LKPLHFTFDDDVQRAAAQADPVGYVADLPERAVLDEVQRAPDRFILVGSANVLLVAKLADSLAGRMEVLQNLSVKIRGSCQSCSKPPSGQDHPDSDWAWRWPSGLRPEAIRSHWRVLHHDGGWHGTGIMPTR
jgi:hypothetical protein